MQMIKALAFLYNLQNGKLTQRHYLSALIQEYKMNSIMPSSMNWPFINIMMLGNYWFLLSGEEFGICLQRKRIKYLPHSCNDIMKVR